MNYYKILKKKSKWTVPLLILKSASHKMSSAMKVPWLGCLSWWCLMTAKHNHQPIIKVATYLIMTHQSQAALLPTIMIQIWRQIIQTKNNLPQKNFQRWLNTQISEKLLVIPALPPIAKSFLILKTKDVRPMNNIKKSRKWEVTILRHYHKILIKDQISLREEQHQSLNLYKHK